MTPRRVMLVDDSESFLEIASAAVLADPQLELVGTARSALEALNRIGDLHPDLVLMGLMMPGMSGLEATYRMKCQPNPPRVVLLALDDGPLHRMGAREVCADGLLIKGDLSSRLSGLVRALFRRTRHASWR